MDEIGRLMSELRFVFSSFFRVFRFVCFLLGGPGNSCVSKEDFIDSGKKLRFVQ